jgi:site-specific DNA-methyltransferase (cytosine-N4-specific)
MRGNARRTLPSQLLDNKDDLPTQEAQLCLDLHSALGDGDGFRRQAVPMLLYRYFAAMKESFRSVKAVMKPGAPYGLIVGHNHSTIGGVKREFDTPSHLANLALSVGWQIEELVPLQTYRRYGYHVSNAVAAETLIILRNT